MDMVGKKILLRIISIALIVLGILFMNRIISISITGNGFYDSILLIMLGLFVFIIGQTYKGSRTMSGF